MHLAHATLRGVAPFGELKADFCDEHGKPRAITIVHGGAGVGKTTLLQALACTRPGHATVASSLSAAEDGPPLVRCAWHLGEDEPARPHSLLVSTPGSSSLLGPSPDDDGALQRREQALFDRRAREQGGFVFLLFPANRWFSRQAVSLHAPSRSMLRYDVRATTSFDQASSADLTRETKQALAYAAISSALSLRREHGPVDRRRADPHLLGAAMRETVDGVVRLTGMRYEGLHPLSFEPRFVSAGGRALDFDALPTRTRHLVAYVAITIKTLWAAYPSTDPRTAEGVVAIDDVDLHQDAHVLAELVPILRSSLLGVQWILTTASPVLAASAAPDQVLALRRMAEDEPVSLFVDAHARTH